MFDFKDAGIIITVSSGIEDTRKHPFKVQNFRRKGRCQLNRTIEIRTQKDNTLLGVAQNKAEIEKVKALYKKAEPFFLKVKEMEPDDPSRWASRLSTIYYILGDEAKQKEMDALLQ